MFSHCLKSKILEHSLLSPPATSHFSHNLPSSWTISTLDLLETALTHNTDPHKCLYTRAWLFLEHLPLPKLCAWQTPTSSFQSQPQNHLSTKPFMTLLPTQSNHYLFYAALESYTYFTLCCDHTLAGVTNTNISRDQPGIIDKWSI